MIGCTFLTLACNVQILTMVTIVGLFLKGIRLLQPFMCNLLLLEILDVPKPVHMLVYMHK